MPKITTTRRDLEDLLGYAPEPEELRRELLKVKGELDDWGEAPAGEDCDVKIELNDTNRPDTWTPEGIARQLKGIRSGEYPTYGFLGAAPVGHVEVDPSVEAVRPIVGAFIAKGPALTDAGLRSLIQTQEKLSDTFGRRRKDIAAGIYRLELCAMPVRYGTVAKDAEGFVPLGETATMTPAQILAEHPKGKEYAHCLAGEDRYPLLTGADGRVLSMPPIINSADLGAVEVGDTALFVEFTGSSIELVNVAVAVMAADMADRGFTIERLESRFPFDTPWGRQVTFPHDPKGGVTVTPAEISRCLGVAISADEAAELLTRYGLTVECAGDSAEVTAPFYRNDLLHPVDVIEDVAICRGYDSFARVMPAAFTVGRLEPVQTLADTVRERVVGLGFQEFATPVLTHRDTVTTRMTRAGAGLVEIRNPMSENYGVVRDSLLPSLLEVEERSYRAAYPHRTFEVGEVASKDGDARLGSVTRRRVAALVSHAEASFAEIHAVLDSLLIGLGYAYELDAAALPGYFAGRAGKVLVGGVEVGAIGEVDPAVLEHFGVKMPSAGFELDLHALMGA